MQGRSYRKTSSLKFLKLNVPLKTFIKLLALHLHYLVPNGGSYSAVLKIKHRPSLRLRIISSIFKEGIERFESIIVKS